MDFGSSHGAGQDARMRRLTINLCDDLERALADAARHFALPPDASDSARLLAYARRGYVAALEEELDRERLETYRRWAGSSELMAAGEAARRAAKRGAYSDG
jgi:hypothetical protein